MPSPRLPALALALFALGCGVPDTGPGPYGDPIGTTRTGPEGTGRIFIAWTLDGAAPSEERCRGVDRLELILVYARAEVSIAPIPCNLLKFRYDKLPEGNAELILGGLDARGRCLRAGGAVTRITQTLPDPPAPVIDLRPSGCN